MIIEAGDEFLPHSQFIRACGKGLHELLFVFIIVAQPAADLLLE
jgi:hypothetical protein